MQTRGWARPGWRSASSVSAPGRSAAAAGSGAGARRTTPTRSPPSARALELGVNWIDTAPVYGFGRSEEVVGRALAEMSERPSCSASAASRAGTAAASTSSRPRRSSASARIACAGCGIEAIDLYQIHWPDPDEDIEEGWAACAALLDAGKVRHIGVSNFSVAQLERIGALAPVESLQPPYSLIDRDIEQEILPYCGRGRSA